MSRMLASLAAVFALLGGITLFSVGSSNHTHDITFIGSAGQYSKKVPLTLIEIDAGFTTTFNITNDTDADLDFVYDAGPNGRKCRVNFTPPSAPGKCETAVITIPKTQTRSFTASAKSDMGRFDYSWFKIPGVVALPHFATDIKVAATGARPQKVDPDLELERDMRFWLIELVIAILLAVSAFVTRRRASV